jgi:hypothetical protein
MTVEKQIRMGFRPTGGSVHLSRTLMLEDLTTLMGLLAAEPLTDLKAAVVEENCLGKPTVSTRRITYGKLVTLYGLDDKVPLFRTFRQLWAADQRGRPLLAFLIAAARDPVLKAVHQIITKTTINEVIAAKTVEDFLALTFGDTLQPTTRRSASRSIRSSWSQAGFLSALKVRTRPVVTAEALTLALWIGIVEGYRDQRLLECPSVASLELSLTDKENLLQAARQRGAIEYRNAGGIIEIRLPKWFTSQEKELLHV